MSEKPANINGIEVYRFDIFEIVNDRSGEVLKRNTVFTERDLFNNISQDIVDNFLSRDRLNKKASESGGYIGYIDANNIMRYNPDLVDFLQLQKSRY